MKSGSGPEISFDHVGIAVNALDSDVGAYAFWQALGWVADSDPEVVEGQKVKVAILPLNNDSQIELLEPTSNDSPVKKFLDKRGPGIHHLCLRVIGIEAILVKLQKAGVKLINETPVPGAHNCRVAFVHPSSTGGVLVELSERNQ